MTSVNYQCLCCGHDLEVDPAAAVAQVMPCPKCGRDMYREREGDVLRGGLPTLSATPGRAPSLAIPSRYASSIGPVLGVADPTAEDVQVLVPRTPLVVILGLIFAVVIPPAGLIISVISLRLVNDSPRGVRGKELAVAGIVVGAVMTVLVAVLLLAGK